MGLKYTPELIAMVKGAQEHGLDVTTERYPYTARSTALQTAIFDPGWQENMGITYKDVQCANTGERLTVQTFEKYRKHGGIAVIHSIPEEAARSAVANPIVDEPLQYSEGIPFVLVNGILVVKDSQLVEGVRPGRAARAPIAN